MFVHFGIVHLAINMWALWDSCRFVERLYGHGRFLVIYGAGGMAGNLFSLLAHGDSAVSGGASGAIFSAYGALLTWLWRERLQIDPVEFRWLFGGAAAFAAATIAMGLLIPGIDNAAHLGGLVCGAPAYRWLEILKRYSRMRGDASHALSEALLQNDPQRVREALEALRRAAGGNYQTRSLNWTAIAPSRRFLIVGTRKMLAPTRPPSIVSIGSAAGNQAPSR